MAKKTKKNAEATTKTATAPVEKKTRKAPKATVAEKAPAQEADATPTEPGDEVCVFAIRLLRSERDLIHQVAGSGKATKFVKSLAVAAAKGDLDTIHSIVGEVVRAK